MLSFPANHKEATPLEMYVFHEIFLFKMKKMMETIYNGTLNNYRKYAIPV